MLFLDFLKPQAKFHSVLPDSKSVGSAMTIELGKYTLIVQWMRGWQIEMPKQPRHAPDCEGWDPGAIVNYWFAQPGNVHLNQEGSGLSRCRDSAWGLAARHPFFAARLKL